MDKHTIIVIIAALIIAGTVLYSFMGINGLNDIQLRWYQKEFSYPNVMTGGKIELCNPTQTLINLNHFETVIFYQDNKIVTIASDAISLFPLKTESITAKSEFGENSASILPMFLNTDVAENGMNFDLKQVSVTTSYESKFLGFIPYSVSKKYDGFEFEEIMNQRKGNFYCQ